MAKRSKFPDTIDIFGAKHQVIFAKELEDSCHKCDGYYLRGERKIFIDEEAEELGITFLHECFHGVLYRLGITGNISEDFEEVIVEGIAKFIDERLDWKIKKKVSSQTPAPADYPKQCEREN